MEKEKREIRMEKIVNLLNEYEGQESWSYDKKYGIYIGWGDDLDYECFICSKKYGFIKWLVENEKIDYEKIGKKIGMENDIAHFPINKYWYVYDNEMGSISSADYSDLESLLMLLSIQDEPIEFLVSILK